MHVGSTYLGKDDQETRLTAGTVADNDELSSQFRHGVCVLCEEQEDLPMDLMCDRCGCGVDG